MGVIVRASTTGFALFLFVGAATGSLSAQPQSVPDADLSVIVNGARPIAGPEIRGIISARKGDKVQVANDDGTNTVVVINEGTRISASKGLFGLGRDRLPTASLLNGLPVTIKTLQSADGLIATQINLMAKDLKTAAMIRNGTDQRFAEQAAATEALRSRVSDIDQYNVKSTTNVNFAIGKAILSPQAKNDLCAAAATADAIDNALLLVVGYTDSTGSAEFNQQLSEKRAERVVNHLQQACGWKPYRMLTPTGMSEADPLADNGTADGKAQNRRVSVNVMVSKGLDGL